MFGEKKVGRKGSVIVAVASVILAGGAVRANLSSFGAASPGIQMPDNSGNWGPFHATNNTLTFNTWGVKALTVAGQAKQANVVPMVGDGWYSVIAEKTPVLKISEVVWAIDTSTWFNAAQNVAGPWQASFTWHEIGESAGASGGGFGFYFAVQHNSHGLHLIGQNGPNMGLTTRAVMSRKTGGKLKSATAPANTLGIGINNTSGTYLNDNNALTSKNGMLQVVVGKTVLNVAITGVNFVPAANSKTLPPPVHISISYDGATTITFKAVQGKKTFSHIIKLPESLSVVMGGPTGYVGFTSATADHRFGPTEAQGITHFSFHTGAPSAAGAAGK